MMEPRSRRRATCTDSFLAQSCRDESSARTFTRALCNMFSSTLGRRRKFHQLGIVVPATLFVAGVRM